MESQKEKTQSEKQKPKLQTFKESTHHQMCDDKQMCYLFFFARKQAIFILRLSNFTGFLLF